MTGVGGSWAEANPAESGGRTMLNAALKMMKFALKMMKCVSKMMNYVSTMMN